MLTGLLSALCVAILPLSAQSPDMFKEVNRPHWEYGAAEELCRSGLAPGYPANFFSKRVLTRYEFAVALNRATTTLGDVPPADDPAFELSLLCRPQQVPPVTVAALVLLAAEFQEELRSIACSTALAMISHPDMRPRPIGPCKEPSCRYAVTTPYVQAPTLFPDLDSTRIRSRFRLRLGLPGEPP